MIKVIRCMKSPTIKSIEALNGTVAELEKSGIDPIFILAALAQVLHDVSQKADLPE